MFDNLTPVVKALIIINVVFFIGSGFVAPQLTPYLVEWYIEHPYFEIWQPLTSMFMHANIPHIFMNMYGLLIFGPILERWMGTNKFIIFYFASGIGAWLLSLGIGYYNYETDLATMLENGLSMVQSQNALFNNSNLYGSARYSLGASGCVFGVLAAFAYLYPNYKLQIILIPVPIAAKWLIGAYLCYELLSLLNIINLQTGVGHAAHIGGAVIGFILTWYWKRNSMDKYRWDS